MTEQPTFHGIRYLALSVTDLPRSVRWYEQVLGFVVDVENYGSRAWPSDWDEVQLKHPSKSVRLGLQQHPANDGRPFSEFQTGLDHVEFDVAEMSELEAWRGWLDAHGVSHSGAHSHIVTFRDPDNIQLELYCLAGRTL
jgi:glyoxylase I family protein